MALITLALLFLEPLPLQTKVMRVSFNARVIKYNYIVIVVVTG